MIDVVPLGGLGEIGLNTMAVVHGGERMLIDCGLMFPRSDQFGVDVVIPDFGWLLDEPASLQAIVLTHAHEDHLGALPWLLRELPVPVYGTRFTLALARHKLEEAGLRADLREMAPRTPFRVGTQFTVEPIRVTHSVPDAVALAVTTSSGTAIHTGDFKLDGMPTDGQLTDLERFGELGERGVTVLLSDSTNAEVPGWTGSEQLVRETFERLVSTATQRVIVGLFGSHLHRVHALMQLARRFNRRVILGGRSLIRNVELAREAGILSVPEGLLVAWENAGEVPPAQQLVICTGAQAEPLAALSRLADGGGGPVRIDDGDTVVLSSRTIPGNEQAVSLLVNRLLARGARLAYASIEPGVHVSGHASQDEQRKMIEVVQPKHFVPIHGELRHLLQHRELARRAGLDDSRTFVLTDGDSLRLDPSGVTTRGKVPAGHLLTRRDGFGTVTEAVLAERRAVAADGVVVCAVALPPGGGTLLSGPTVSARGLQGDELAALSLAADGARLALSEMPTRELADDERVREALTRGVRRVFKQLLGTRPHVMPVVLRVTAAKRS
ncbi:MAG: ribonuclease J [Archangium sp.]|nr:ribonuclease J [Archangium sp.]